MPAMPTGTVTFLFTDIQGSTPLWEQMPEQMQVSVAEHHAILRRVIEECGGRVFKIVGDAYQAAFITATDGVAAAIEAQRALQCAQWNATGPLLVRMGLHTGPAELDPIPGPGGVQEYSVSHTLNRVARVMSAGHGGQILLSQEAADLVVRRLPPGVRLEDLGEYRLKGMQWPEHLYQAVVPGLPEHFPALSGALMHANNLPLQLTSFIGREKETAEVKRLLESARLLTLTGPGGTGKTRLSLRVAADLLERFPDGVWLVEFAPVTNPALVAQGVASVLRLREEADRPLTETLIAFLRQKTTLLILDNCEHLVEAIAGLADTLLRCCPRLQVLASSRELLGVGGEVSYRVPSLTVPVLPTTALPADEFERLTQYEAVRLFIDRAVAVRPDFHVTNSNAPALAQVCCRLDGIPLALELAAARVRAMTVEQIAARLDDRFRLLTGGSRTALPRQQTLRATIDWSYDFLPEAERVLLNRLAAFVGGCTLEAAEVVCSDPDHLPENMVLEALTRLVDKSLVFAEEAGGETRYHLLETIRQYTREKLLDSGEAEQVHNRHLNYFLSFARRMDVKMHGPEEFAALEQMERDLENFRAALDWSLGPGRVEQGLLLVYVLGSFLYLKFLQKEGYERAAALLAQPEGAPGTLARASGLYAAGNLCSDWKAKRVILEELVPLARGLGVPAQKLLALALAKLSDTIYGEETERAVSLLEEAGVLAHFLNDPFLTGQVYGYQGMIFEERKDFSNAQRQFEEALRICQAAGDRRGAAWVRIQLAGVRYLKYDIAESIQQWEEVIPFFREIKDWRSLSDILSMLSDIERANKRYDVAKKHALEVEDINQRFGRTLHGNGYHLGFIALYEGDLDTARRYITVELLEAKKRSHTIFVSWGLLGLAWLLALRNKARPAAVIMGYYESSLNTSDRRVYTPADVMDEEGTWAAIRARLDEATIQAAVVEGQCLSMEQAVAYAFAADA